MDSLPENNRPTYRIEEEEDEDDSREILYSEHYQNITPPPRPFGGGALPDDGNSSGEDSGMRLTFSDIAKKIQNPSISPNASTGSVSGRDRSDGSSGLRSTGKSSKRIFGGGSSDAADQALSKSSSHADHGESSSSSSQDGTISRAAELGMNTSDAVLRSGSSDSSSSRRKYLQTIHSERSLKSEASSGNKSTNTASMSEPSPKTKHALGTTGPVDNKSTGMSGTSSPNRRSLMRRAPGAIKPSQQNTEAQRSSPPSRRNPSLSLGGSSSNSSNNNKSANTRRANLLASRLASRSTAVKTRLNTEVRKGGALGVIGGLGNSGGGVSGDNYGHGDIDVLAGGGVEDKHATARRYKPGDNVLVCNQQSRWSTLVNRYGFPPGEGSSPEEMRGPYIYAMATVKQVHFEEFAAYYTVVRADTGAEHRADADFMEPLKTTRGQQAAYRAALQSSLEQGVVGSEIGPGHSGEHPFPVGVGDAREAAHSSSMTGRNKILSCLENTCVYLLLPFLYLYDCLYLFALRWLTPLGKFMLRHAKLILMGAEPYACQLRLTLVNFIVVCSIWYMFIDQARLVFFRPRADHTVAVFNFIVWLVLLCELLFEVFIRPDGYKKLIISEKAFSPQTVRFINAFHFVVEMFSLLMFIPEFYCLFSRDSCSTRFRFSFYNAALMAVTGPTRTESTYGRAFFALVRLRVFGVVRHWKNMWITNTFLMGRKREAGWFSSIFPPRASHKTQATPALKRQDSNRTDGGLDGTKGVTGGSDPQKDGDGDHDNNQNNENKDLALTNASNIGTALMVTNSYRAISLLWVITGIFPIFIYSMNSILINNVAPEMTDQLQATNLIANDTSDETCEFLFNSVHAWILAVVAPDAADDPSDPYLVSLTIEPDRCNISANICEEVVTSTDSSEKLCDLRRELLGKSLDEMADVLGVRSGSIVTYDKYDFNYPFLNYSEPVNTTFSVVSSFDQSYTIATA